MSLMFWHLYREYRITLAQTCWVQGLAKTFFAFLAA